MKKLLDSVRGWFTPATREKLYTAIAAIAPILVTAGVIASDQVEPILVIVAAVLQAFAGLLALANLRPTEAARWFGTVGRGVIYGLASTVAAAIVVLGVVTEEWASTALTYTSLGLTFLAAILAVVTPKEVAFDRSEIPVAVEAVVVDNAVVTPVVDGVQVASEVAPEVVVESHENGR